MLTNADILSEMQVLSDFKGRAKSGSTTTLMTNVDLGDIDGNYICFLNGNNRGVDTFISTYDELTGEITFDEVASPVTSTQEFAIIKDGYLAYSESAKSRIIEDFKNISKDYELFITTSQLKQLTLYYTMSLICLDLFQDGVSQDLYWSRYERYQHQYDTTFSKFKADYDANEDGVISDDEEASQGASSGVVRR